jgi:hypothetical protein
MKLLVIGSLLSVLIPLLTFIEPVSAPEKSITNYTVTNAKADPQTIEEPVEDIPEKEYVPVPVGDPYLMSLGQSVNVHLPIVFGKCSFEGYSSEQLLGCYYLGSDKIIITEYALAWGEDHVKCVILHESRHHWQDEKGLIKMENGEIVNRDWLELDAYDYAGC